jgi:hypothetical protein
MLLEALKGLANDGENGRQLCGSSFSNVLKIC